MKSNILFQAHGVSKTFQKSKKESLHVLDHINLTVYHNEIVALLGRSGSGKSTLLRLIAGLTEPSSGSLICDGQPVSGPCQDTSMVFQSFALFPWLTVFDNVAFGLQAQKIPLEEIRRRTTQMINVIGLSGYENAYPKEISGGMRQRVGFARALAVEPKLLLLDEPFSALDIFTSHKLRNELVNLWEEKEISTHSMVIVTHNIEEAVAMSDRILLLSSHPGRIIEEFIVDIPRHARSKETIADRVEQISEIFNQQMAKCD